MRNGWEPGWITRCGIKALGTNTRAEKNWARPEQAWIKVKRWRYFDARITGFPSLDAHPEPLPARHHMSAGTHSSRIGDQFCWGSIVVLFHHIFGLAHQRFRQALQHLRQIYNIVGSLQGVGQLGAKYRRYHSSHSLHDGSIVARRHSVACAPA